jgi:hypothetical protein
VSPIRGLESGVYLRSLPLPLRLKLTLAVAALLVAWALASLAAPGAGDGDPAGPATRVQTLGSIGVPDELVPDVTQEINANILSGLGQPAGLDLSGFGSNLGAGLPQQTLSPGDGLPGLAATATQPAASQGSGLQGQSVSTGGSIQAVFAKPDDDSDAGSSGEDDSGEDGDDKDGTSNLSGAGGSGGGAERSGDDGKDGDDEDDDDDKKDDDKKDDD